MRCPGCQHENRSGARFCEACGSRLVSGCAGCGAELSPAARFCSACGRPRDAGAPIPPGDAAADPAVDAESRPLTVMFCDLVGYTPLAERLDAEDLRDVLQAYQVACTEAVEEFGGHVAQHLGDGLLVYFGYPRSFENNAERGARAALAILERLAELNGELEAERGFRLAARIGLHAGRAVVGELGGGARREILALGDTTNIAARLRESAEPDTIVVSDAVVRLAGDRLETRDLGTPPLKGISEPIRAHRLVGARPTSETDPHPPTPLVGRAQELGLLVDRWEQAREGSGQVLLLSGEPGIGKSRLAEAFRARIANAPHTWLAVRCSPFAESSTLHPVIDLLRRRAEIADDDPEDAVRAKLAAALERGGPTDADGLAALESLLGVEGPAPAPREARERIERALLAWLLGQSERGALVVLVEDLHWADPSTLELLGRLLEQVPTHRIALLATHRPEFRPPWPPRAYVTPVALGRLSRRHVAELIARVAGDQGLPEALAAEIAARTDGVPLFVEELTKAMLEATAAEGTGGTARRLAIPATLQDSLAARLDRLGDVKEVAQLCAALGREVPYDLLRTLADREESALVHALDRLVDAELLYRRGVPPRATFSFKHALIQETAYQSLLRNRRRELHARIARALAEEFPERAEADPEVLARHCEEAGLVPEALDALERAAHRSMLRSAPIEAMGQLERALALLESLPADAEREARELRLRAELGAPLVAVRGWSSPEVARCYERVRALCEATGDASQLSRALYGLSGYHLARGELERAHERAEELRALASREGGESLRLEAHVSLGLPLFYQGRLAEAETHFETTADLHDPARHGRLAYAHGRDPGALARSYAAMALWLRGSSERALTRSREALEQARRGSAEGSPSSLAFALAFAAVLRQLRGEPEPARAYAEEAITIAGDRGFTVSLGTARIVHGWALAHTGRPDAGVAEIRGGMTQHAAAGTGVGAPFALLLLAQAELLAGHEAEAVAALDAGMEIGARQGSAVVDAELWRMRGELVRPRSADEARVHFERALEVARAQGARPFELRAVLALVRLDRAGGSPDSARAELARLAGELADDDTPDLREAAALLAPPS